MGSKGQGGSRGECRFRLVFIISDGHVIQCEDVRRMVRILKEKGVVLVALLSVWQKSEDAENILDMMRAQCVVLTSRAA